jgi:hypothetical protein
MMAPVPAAPDEPTEVVGLRRTARGSLVAEPVGHSADRSPARWVALAALLAFLLVVLILVLGH